MSAMSASKMSSRSSSPSVTDEVDQSFTLLPSPKLSLYETLKHSGTANVLESLQAQLQMREGEIAQLQQEIVSMERTRASLTNDLTDVMREKESLEQSISDMPLLEQKYSDLDSRYQALLQMYGEKVEEATELRLDLHDIKDMYRSQIDELLKTPSRV